MHKNKIIGLIQLVIKFECENSVKYWLTDLNCVSQIIHIDQK